MSLNMIRSKVIESLLEMYSIRSEDELKKIFKEYYLLDYDIFVKQTIFEVYYENYINSSSIKSIASMFNGSDLGLAENPNYKKTIRAYKKYRIHQDDLSINLNSGKDVQFKHLKHGKESFKGQQVYGWQQNQLNNLVSDKYNIFKEITKKTLGDMKKLSNKKIVDYLNEYENIYFDIENQEENFFNRSIQYYQLEIGNRIETWYMVANKLNNSNLTSENKKRIITELKCLNSVSYENRNFQNKFIVGIDKYIDYHIDAHINNIKNVYRVPNEIYIQNNNKYLIRKHILKYIEDEKIDLDYDEYSLLCKDYFGNLQHIDKHKNWFYVIKTFRLAFKEM